MRLFIALNFSDSVKDRLCARRDYLKAASAGGNFTRRENLHLTLAFLGETEKDREIREAMQQVKTSVFSFEVGGLGVFRRTGGDLYWLAIQDSPQLKELHTQLWDSLSRIGFMPEDRPFKPHLTLGRQVILNTPISKQEFSKQFSPLTVEAAKISLVKSARVNGTLVYTELANHPLMKMSQRND